MHSQLKHFTVSDSTSKHGDGTPGRTLGARTVSVHLLVVGLLVIVVLVAVWLGFGRLAAEKTLTLLALPGGLVALTLGYACFLAARFTNSRWLTVVLTFTLGLYCFVGSGWPSDRLFQQLEQDFYHLRPLESEGFDTLIVLGGGTTQLDDGRVQVNLVGADRIVLAARMYHAHKTRRIVLLGGAEPHKFRSGAEAAATLLTQLGVAPDHIQTLVAENTWGEFQEVKTIVEGAGEGRVGLVTSAWHMRRAMRLAIEQGVDVVPVPADFLSLDRKTTPAEWIPSGWDFGKFTVAAKEYLAVWVGR